MRLELFMQAREAGSTHDFILYVEKSGIITSWYQQDQNHLVPRVIPTRGAGCLEVAGRGKLVVVVKGRTMRTVVPLDKFGFNM